MKQFGWKCLYFLIAITILVTSVFLLCSFTEKAAWYVKVMLVVVLFGEGYLESRVDSHIIKKPKAKKPVKDMSGLDFESYCAKVLLSKGFTHVMVTPASGDFGADLIAQDDRGQKWVFQCKRYNGKVNNSAVQEVVAAKAHYKADKAGVMTNSRLTEKARQLAWENEIMLYECID